MSSNSLVLTAINGEPRVHDLHLAEHLGFDRPRDIRKIIKRNEDKLLKFGGCATVARVVEGNETTEFYLNQKQAIFICMKSETERAFDVQIEIVHVFDAYLNGELNGDDLPPLLPIHEPISPAYYRQLQDLVRHIGAHCHAHGKARGAVWARLRHDYDADSVLRLPVESFESARSLLTDLRLQSQAFFKEQMRREDLFINEVIRRGSRLQLVLPMLPTARN
jgi:hypothetical protein